jgi:ribonuclease HI
MFKTKKYYGVAKGKKPGVYTEWFGKDGAQIQINGFSGAIFKGFITRSEAEAFVRRYNDTEADSAVKSIDTEPAPEYRIPRKAVSKPRKQRGTPPPGAEDVVIYTDGGCRTNPGPGGYGAIVQIGSQRTEYSGGFRLTTNNRMELMACIVGLSSLKTISRVSLYSDSQYVVNGISRGWAKRWRKNNWMRNKEERAINPDLWERLLELCSKHAVTFNWVKGHANNQGNERCDQLAASASLNRNLAVDEIYEAEYS